MRWPGIRDQRVCVCVCVCVCAVINSTVCFSLGVQVFVVIKSTFFCETTWLLWQSGWFLFVQFMILTKSTLVFMKSQVFMAGGWVVTKSTSVSLTG